MMLKKLTNFSILIKLISANQNQTNENSYNDILKDLGLEDDDRGQELSKNLRRG